MLLTTGLERSHARAICATLAPASGLPKVMAPNANAETIKPLLPRRMYGIGVSPLVENRLSLSLPAATQRFVNRHERRCRSCFALRELILRLQHRPFGVEHG